MSLPNETIKQKDKNKDIFRGVKTQEIFSMLL